MHGLKIEETILRSLNNLKFIFGGIKMKKKVISLTAAVAVTAFMSYGCMCNKKVAKPIPVQKTKVVQAQPAPVINKVVAPSVEQLKTILVDIHFNFDKYNLTTIDKYGIQQNVIQRLDTIGTFMKKYPSIKVRIEGNCDERGTEEYNLALGLKRAEAAKQYLISKGVSQDRIDIISYGEDKPLVEEHNENAWAKNRRDHFSVLAK